MARTENGGHGYVVLASLFWALCFSVVSRLTRQGVAPLVVTFHVVLWAAGAGFLLILLTGRTDELNAFKRKESHFLALLATGGYGFWLFQALALRELEPSSAHLAFYIAPLATGLVLAFRGEATPQKHLAALLLAFVGAIMIFRDPSRYGQQGVKAAALWTRGYGAAAGWAACWVIFSLVARSLLEEVKALPAAVLLLATGAGCLLITCIGAGENVLALNTTQLLACIGAGGVAAAGAFALWLKALSRISLVSASALWYVGVLFAAGWAYWLEGWAPGWWALGGSILILLGVRGGQRQERRQGKTLGDIIRSSWGEG